MIFISASELAAITNGVLYKINPLKAKELLVQSIVTHSNQKSKNSLFIALKGKKFDGHFFAKDAINFGSIILLVNRKLNINCPQIIVDDTRYAMGKIAKWYRLKSDAKVLALTGSSGKTTVKEMVTKILMQRGPILFTKKNFNNDIGISLTLFNLKKEHKYIIIEIGANKIGEIKYVTNIVKPDSALVNNLSVAHISGFGSIHKMAESKGEIFSKLSKNGVAVINLDSNNFLNWKKYFNIDQSVLFFSFKKEKDSKFYVKNVKINLFSSKFDLYTPKGMISINLPLIGKHNVLNAIAASALSMSVGANLKNISVGLQNFSPIQGRMFPIYLSSKKILLDDTYNANMGSMTSAIHVLSLFPGYKICVLGEMSELGKKSFMYHKEIGKIIKKMNFDKLLTFGKKSFFYSQNNQFSEHFKYKKSLILRLILLIKKNDSVSILVKGSRKSFMEEIVKFITEYFLC